MVRDGYVCFSRLKVGTRDLSYANYAAFLYTGFADSLGVLFGGPPFSFLYALERSDDRALTRERNCRLLNAMAMAGTPTANHGTSYRKDF